MKKIYDYLKDFQELEEYLNMELPALSSENELSMPPYIENIIQQGQLEEQQIQLLPDCKKLKELDILLEQLRVLAETNYMKLTIDMNPDTMIAHIYLEGKKMLSCDDWYSNNQNPLSNVFSNHDVYLSLTDRSTFLLEFQYSYIRSL